MERLGSFVAGQGTCLAHPRAMVPVHEDYKTYSPPPWGRHTVCELLNSLSPGHIGDLRAIVLTESAQIPKGKTGRIASRKHDLKRCFGFYHGRRQREQPTIVLVMDNIVQKKPGWYWRLPLFRNVALGDVLFHEVGHHLNGTVGPLAKGEKASAEEWKRRLSRIHVRRKYWYLRPIRKPMRIVFLCVQAIARWRSTTG